MAEPENMTPMQQSTEEEEKAQDEVETAVAVVEATDSLNSIVALSDEMPTNEQIRKMYQAKCEELVLAPTEERFSRFLAYFHRFCSGTVCNLREVGFGPLAISTLAQVLQKCSRYHSIVLSGNPICDDGAEALSSLLSVNSSIVAIDARGCEIGNRGLASLFEAITKSKTLTSVDLSALSGSNRNRMGMKSAKACAECLGVSPVLSWLSLRETGLDPQMMNEFSEADSFLDCRLSALDLSGNLIGPHGLKFLSQSTSKSVLESLTVQRCGLCCVGAEEIANAIRTNHLPMLTDLDLTDNDIRTNGANAFAALFESDVCPLKRINFSKNPLTAEGIAKIFATLAANSLNLITEANFSSCKAEQLGAVKVADFITSSKYLTKLIFDDNNIGDEGCVSIAKASTKCASLNTISLVKNHIGDQGGQEIARALESDDISIHSLLLDDNHIRESGDAIAIALEINDVIRKLTLTQNSISYRAFDKIESKLAENKRKHALSYLSKLKKVRSELRQQEKKLNELQSNLNNEKDELNNLRKKNADLTKEIEENSTLKEVSEKKGQDVIIELSKNLDDSVFRASMITKEINSTKLEKEVAYKNVLSKHQKEKDNSIKLQKQIENCEKEKKNNELTYDCELSSLEEAILKTKESNAKVKRELEKILEEISQSNDPVFAQKLNSLYKKTISRLIQENILPESMIDKQSRNFLMSRGSLQLTKSSLALKDTPSSAVIQPEQKKSEKDLSSTLKVAEESKKKRKKKPIKK